MPTVRHASRIGKLNSILRLSRFFSSWNSSGDSHWNRIYRCFFDNMLNDAIYPTSPRGCVQYPQTDSLRHAIRQSWLNGWINPAISRSVFIWRCFVCTAGFPKVCEYPKVTNTPGTQFNQSTASYRVFFLEIIFFSVLNRRIKKILIYRLSEYFSIIKYWSNHFFKDSFY